MRQTEEVLVQERLARQTEAAQQAMGSSVLTGERVLTVQSLVDTKAIGRPPTLSEDIDTSGQPEGMLLSQWSFVFRSYLSAYDSVATRLLQQVEAKVEHPSVVDNESMTEAERRLSVQLFYVLALTCKGKSLQVVRRVPEGFGFEAWKQLCREFEPRLPSRFQGMLQALLSPTTTDDPAQTIYQWESRVKVYEEQSGDEVSENIKLAVLQKYRCDGELARHLNLQSGRLTTYELARKEAINYLRAKQTWTPGTADPMDLTPPGKGKGGKIGKSKGKGDKTPKPKPCFHCGKPGHSKERVQGFLSGIEAEGGATGQSWTIRWRGSGP